MADKILKRNRFVLACERVLMSLKKVEMCITDPLCCAPETNTTL